MNSTFFNIFIDENINIEYIQENVPIQSKILVIPEYKLENPGIIIRQHMIEETWLSVGM